MLFTDSDHVEEFRTILQATPQLSYEIKHYNVQRLQTFIQTSAINKLKRSLKDVQSKIFIVLGHKQKIIPMKYFEGQAGYYGKEKMRMLGTMEAKCDRKTNVDGNPCNEF